MTSLSPPRLTGSLVHSRVDINRVRWADKHGRSPGLVTTHDPAVDTVGDLRSRDDDLAVDSVARNLKFWESLCGGGFGESYKECEA